MCATQRRTGVVVLTVVTLVLLGFVYVDAVPLRKSLRNAQQAQGQQDPNQQQQMLNNGGFQQQQVQDNGLKQQQFQNNGIQQQGNGNPQQNVIPQQNGNAPQQFQGDGNQAQQFQPTVYQQQGNGVQQQQVGLNQQQQVGLNQQQLYQANQNQQHQQAQGNPNQHQQQPQIVAQQQQQQQQQPFGAPQQQQQQQPPQQFQNQNPNMNQQGQFDAQNAAGGDQHVGVGVNPTQSPRNLLLNQGTGGLGGPVGGLGAPNPNLNNVQMLGGVQQLGGVQGGAQVQRPASDGAKPDNLVVDQQGVAPQQDMAAGGGPNGGAKAEVRAPPPAQEGEDQVPQPEPVESIRLAKVPNHREQQIEQPKVEPDDDKHPLKKAVFLDSHKALKLTDIKPPDHLDAVRLEQDGHLNRDYKKEIFLGNHEEIEQGSEKEIKKKLSDIFHKVDTNSDGFIVTSEMEAWITLKVEEHFAEAVQENEHVFKALDTDLDGDITWREFHIQFLMAKGHEQKLAEKHMEDYETIPLDPEDQEQLIRFKFRWAEADEDPQDNKLTIIEFKNFRHPEQSENMLMRMVMDIIENLDKDKDNIVTEEEFAALPPGEVDDQWKESDRMWQDERKKEFKEVMDLNNDGKVTREELKRYVDPKNPQHSKLESQNLIELADTNKDQKISLAEMLENTELFLGSKVVNTGRSFHDEF